jgi:hypothetical protein
MSESTGDSSSKLDEEARRLVEKEHWIVETTNLIISSRVLRHGPINRELANKGVRIASIWFDLFHKQQEAIKPKSATDISALMKKTFIEAVGLANDGISYKKDTPAPIIPVHIAAYDAFCLGFGKDAQEVADLLEWKLECYNLGPSLNND